MDFAPFYKDYINDTDDSCKFNSSFTKLSWYVEPITFTITWYIALVGSILLLPCSLYVAFRFFGYLKKMCNALLIYTIIK